jgi:transposase-like protein
MVFLNVSQHFLLSSAARSLNLVQVLRLSDEEVEAVFAKVRWPETDGEAVCPECGCPICYECRRPSGNLRYRCKACRKDFSITSGTLFASHKLPLRMYLAAIVIFCNEVKGKSSLALSRDLGIHYKSAFVLAHKLREAMAVEMAGRRIGGENTEVEIDGAYFGGYVKPANLRADRKDRRKLVNQNGKRQCVVIARQRDGHIVPAVFKSEGDAIGFIRRRVAKGTTIHADEAGSWNALQGQFMLRRINHQEAYSFAEACTNQAESFFSRIRRGELGHHHHIAGPYLGRYAQESAWREDSRRVANGDQIMAVVGLALMAKPSVDFGGYWQRHIEQ